MFNNGQLGRPRLKISFCLSWYVSARRWWYLSRASASSTRLARLRVYEPLARKHDWPIIVNPSIIPAGCFLRQRLSRKSLGSRIAKASWARKCKSIVTGCMGRRGRADRGSLSAARAVAFDYGGLACNIKSCSIGPVHRCAGGIPPVPITRTRTVCWLCRREIKLN